VKENETIFFTQKYKQKNMFIERYKKILILIVLFLIAFSSKGYSKNSANAPITIQIVKSSSFTIQQSTDDNSIDIQLVGYSNASVSIYHDFPYIDLSEKSDSLIKSNSHSKIVIIYE